MARCLAFSFSTSLAISLAALSFAGCMSELSEAPLTEPAHEQAIADLSVTTSDGNARP